MLRPPSPRRPYTEREAIPEAISAGARIVVLDAVCDDGISLPTVFGISVAEASTNAQAAAFRRPPRWLSPNVKTSGNAAVRRCRGPQLQLTKSAPLGGDSETRTLKGPGEATWASRRAVLTKRTSLLRLVADMKYGRGGHGPYGGVRIIQEELQFGEGRLVAARRQALSGSRAHAPTGIRKGPFQ